MPFKDKDKQREYDRERMRRTRAKKKANKDSILGDVVDIALKYGLAEKNPVILDIVKDNPDMTTEQVLRIYQRLMEGKKKKRDFSFMGNIPDWIFNKIDLQFVQAAGGGLSW